MQQMQTVLQYVGPHHLGLWLIQVTHIVYEPFNSLRASRKTTTDGWGWEGR